MTGACQNTPADNAAGTFQYLDSTCGHTASIAGCVGKSKCRFCHTTMVPSEVRNKGWPTCPNAVCTEMKALGCEGEDTNSKKRVLWQLARDKALKHNAYVKGVSIGACVSSPADQNLGRYQFSDVSCRSIPAPGCAGGTSLCRFCHLSKGKKHNEDWVTCPDVVCKKHNIK